MNVNRIVAETIGNVRNLRKGIRKEETKNTAWA